VPEDHVRNRDVEEEVWQHQLPASPGPLLSLTLATLLMLATAVDTRWDRNRPLWLRVVVRVAVFGAAT
jgi:hypothetical protein